MGLYTIAGGMETVVWADAVQAAIKVIGGVLCLICVLQELPGGFAQVVAVGNAHAKFSLVSLDWDLTQRTFWTVAILGLLNWLNIYSGEQTIVQRYVSARTTWEARKATMIFSGIAVPVWTMFFFIGTSLFVYFKVFPDPAVIKIGIAALRSQPSRQAFPHQPLHRRRRCALAQTLQGRDAVLPLPVVGKIDARSVVS